MQRHPSRYYTHTYHVNVDWLSRDSACRRLDEQILTYVLSNIEFRTSVVFSLEFHLHLNFKLCAEEFVFGFSSSDSDRNVISLIRIVCRALCNQINCKSNNRTEQIRRTHFAQRNRVCQFEYSSSSGQYLIKQQTNNIIISTPPATAAAAHH